MLLERCLDGAGGIEADGGGHLFVHLHVSLAKSVDKVHSNLHVNCTSYHQVGSGICYATDLSCIRELL